MASTTLTPPTPIPKPPKHASVEDALDYGPDIATIYLSTSPAMTSTTCSSAQSSVYEFDGDDEEDVEEIVREGPLSRQDASELARSLWGVIPPTNFGKVMSGVYRSSYPKAQNLSFLKTLKLKTVITLVEKPFPDTHVKFVEDGDIQHYQIGIAPNKDPFITISQCSISAVLGVVMNKANHPILIHCNKGKHRTGCVVGCLRKIMGWEMVDIINEYHHFAAPKARKLDERYIELFDERALLWLARQHQFETPDEPQNESPISTLAVGSRLRG